jgi:hypothetical protein
MKEAIEETIWDRTIKRIPERGGAVVFGSGIQGCGKTSLLFNFANAIIRNNGKKEKIFFRARNPVEFNKFPVWKLLAPEDMNIKFFDADNNEVVYPITRFKDFNDLLAKADFEVINAVYFHDNLTWIDFTDFVVRNPVGYWISLLIDEIEDICPYGVGGDQWEFNKKFSDAVKDARKGFVSIYTMTQKPGDVDWRFRAKVIYQVFLRGSVKTKSARIWQRAIDSLEVGEAWICDAGQFQRIRFDPYPPVQEVYVKIS